MYLFKNVFKFDFDFIVYFFKDKARVNWSKSLIAERSFKDNFERIFFFIFEWEEVSLVFFVVFYVGFGVE